MNESMITVEVAYALPGKQRIISLQVAAGTSAYQAVEASNIIAQFPEIDLDSAKMGVFGKAIPKPKDYQLSEGERVEIYRPLIADPKEVRKQRAAKVKAQKALEKEQAAEQPKD